MKSIVVSMLFVLCFAPFIFSQGEMLVWSDEFETPGAPDPAKWGYDLGAGGWGNNEVQTYTNSTQNARVENGRLIIEARKLGNTWTSARLLTKGKYEFKYGRVVFRAKLPVGSGTWPALWMLGANISSAGWPACGEMDVMEHVGKDPGFVQSAMHTPSSHGNTINKGQKYIATCQTEFHTYQVTWKYNKIEFMYDSVLAYQYSPAVRTLSTWPYDKPAFIIMNIAMGGNMGSDPQYETGGKKNGIDPSLSSATMEIDYVRVYQYPASDGDESGLIPESDKVNLFLPNPTDGKLYLAAPQIRNAKGSIRNTMGIEVYRFMAGDQQKDIDISFLPKGMYILSLTQDDEHFSQKLVLR